MANLEELVEYSALDRAIMVSFVISYSIFALVQLNHLFNRRFVWFGGLVAAAALAAHGIALIDFSAFCVDGPSALLCNRQGEGLTAFGMVWVYVSVAGLAMYGLVRGLRRMVRG